MTHADAWAVLLEADRTGSYAAAAEVAAAHLDGTGPHQPTEDVLGWVHLRITALHLLRRHREAAGWAQRMTDIAPSSSWLALGLAWRAMIDHFLSLDPNRTGPREHGSSALDDLARASLLLHTASEVADDTVLAAAHTTLANGYWTLRLFELAEPHYLLAGEAAVRASAPALAVKARLNHAMMQLEWADEHDQMGERSAALPRYETSAALARDCGGIAGRHGLPALQRRAELFEAAAGARFAPVEHVLDVLARLAERTWTPTAHLAVLQVALSHAQLRAGDRQAALRWARSAVALMGDTLGGPASIQAHQALAAALPAGEHSTELLSYALALARHRWRDRRQLLNAAEMSLDYERVIHQMRISDQLSRSDPMTGLGNRRALEHQVTAWLADPRGPRTAAVLVVDIDGLKSVNDSWGHASGDRVITAVAAHLRAGSGTGGIVIRWGGDEFVVVVPDAQQTDAQRIADQLVTGPLTEDGVPALLSVGTATGALTDLDTLLVAADADMYRRRMARRQDGSTHDDRP